MTSKLDIAAATVIAAITVVAATAFAATPATARHMRSHVYAQHLPYGIDYSHNYGPGALPGTFAYYDGPVGVKCRQSAAAYLGQDGRRHPCN